MGQADRNGGSGGRCGWLKDRFGVSWQIVPKYLPRSLASSDRAADRVMQAMMGMGKIDLPPLKTRFTAGQESGDMAYVDGVVSPVPTASRESFRQFAEDMAVIFKEHGALKLVDCWGDDVPDGEVTSFPMAVKCEEGETVVFSWILWPSRRVRDAGWEKVMADPRMQEQTMPFDGKRMIYGGFEVIAEF